MAARKSSSEEWAQKTAKVGYAGDFAHKLKGIQGALQHWRQQEEATMSGSPPSSSASTS